MITFKYSFAYLFTSFVAAKKLKSEPLISILSDFTRDGWLLQLGYGVNDHLLLYCHYYYWDYMYIIYTYIILLTYNSTLFPATPRRPTALVPEVTQN